jgi:hypothetical protein
MFLIVSSITVLLDFAFKNYQTEADRIFNTYNSKASKVNTLIIGNSHIGVCNYALPPQSNLTGNMCLGNIDIYRIYTLLKTITPYSPQLKKIYLGLDYEMLGYNQTQCGQKYMDYACFKYTGTLYNNSLTNRLMAHSNFFRANRDIAYFIKGQKTKEQLNYIPVETTLSANTTSKKNSKYQVPDLTQCRKRAIDATTLKYSEQYIPENKQYLLQIIKLCKQKHIQLFIINTPKTSCYRTFADTKNLSESGRQIDSLCVNYHIPLLNFYSDTSFPDSLFTDADHLNYYGANLLMKKIQQWQVSHTYLQ